MGLPAREDDTNWELNGFRTEKEKTATRVIQALRRKMPAADVALVRRVALVGIEEFGIGRLIEIVREGDNFESIAALRELRTMAMASKIEVDAVTRGMIAVLPLRQPPEGG